jgi:hypothetical protein
MRRGWSAFSLAVGLLLAAPALQASYGETLTVEVKAGSVIAPGWVVVAQRSSGPSSYMPHVPVRVFLTLVNLNGAPLGEVFEVSGLSPIPPGWEVIGTRGREGLDRYHFNIRYRIEKRYAADDSRYPDWLPPVLEAPLDFDIASLDWKNSR